MAKLIRGASPTSVVLRVKLMDSSVTTGAGLAGLTSASAGLLISTLRLNEAAPTVYTQAGGTIETIATLGTYVTPTATKCRFKEIAATNNPGLYELQLDDARFTSTGLVISLSGAANLAQADFEIQCENLSVNTVQVGGTTQTAGDLKGTLGNSVLTNLSADIQSVLAAVASTGPVAAVAAAGSALTGTVVSGTYADTQTLNGTLWLVSGDATDPASVEITGTSAALSHPDNLDIYGYTHVTGSPGTKWSDVFAWNYNTAAYDQISSPGNRISGTAGTTVTHYSFPLNNNHIGNTGAWKVKITANNALVTTELGIDLLQYQYRPMGNSLSDIAQAVHSYLMDSADIEGSFSEYIRYIYGAFHGYVTTGTSTTQINIAGLPAIAHLYEGYAIQIHNESAGYKETKRIISMDNAGNLVLDSALSWTPNPGDGVRLSSPLVREGTDHKALISTDAQDLSATLKVQTKTLDSSLIIGVKKNTAKTISYKLFLKSDHTSPATGLTPTKKISKDGAAFGVATGASSEIGLGWYRYAASAADLNTSETILEFSDPLVDTRSIVIETVS